jgi:hypothetical protein
LRRGVLGLLVFVALVLPWAGAADVSLAPTATFGAEADSYTSSVSPTIPRGSLTVMKVEGGGAETKNGYVRFTVAGLEGVVTRATLRLYAESTSVTGIDVRAVADNSWDEGTMTYRNAPPFSAEATASSGPFVDESWVSLDVTPLVSGDGTYSFALTTDDPTALNRFATKEIGTAFAPQLVVETAVAPVNTSLPTIAGTAVEGETLTGTAGAWTGTEPLSYAYQWRRCDATGAECADVPEATSPDYALTGADVGFTLRLAVTVTNGGGAATA